VARPIGASSNSFTIEAEQITADATSFWAAPAPPDRISLTNSIVQGTFGGASVVFTQNAAINPSGAVFQAVDNGNYYLAAANSLHQAGTDQYQSAVIGGTAAQDHLPARRDSVNCNRSAATCVFPAAPRLHGWRAGFGLPLRRAGLHGVANLVLAGGTLTVEPGTAVAVRNDLAYWDDYDCIWIWTVSGILFSRIGRDQSRHAHPDKPLYGRTAGAGNPGTACASWRFDVLYPAWSFDAVTFVPCFMSDGPDSPARSWIFRFSNFYRAAGESGPSDIKQGTKVTASKLQAG